MLYIYILGLWPLIKKVLGSIPGPGVFRVRMFTCVCFYILALCNTDRWYRQWTDGASSQRKAIDQYR